LTLCEYRARSIHRINLHINNLQLPEPHLPHPFRARISDLRAPCSFFCADLCSAYNSTIFPEWQMLVWRPCSKSAQNFLPSWGNCRKYSTARGWSGTLSVRGLTANVTQESGTARAITSLSTNRDVSARSMCPTHRWQWQRLDLLSIADCRQSSIG